MNKPMLTGVVLGAALATAGGVFAGYKLLNGDAPAASSAAVAQYCSEQIVTHTADPRDQRRIAGTVVGALVGDAVDEDVGDRDITTAAGAVAGNQIQKKIQEKKTYTATQTRCVPAQR